MCTKYKGRSFVSKRHWEQLINHYGELYSDNIIVMLLIFSTWWSLISLGPDISVASIFPMATIPESFLDQVTRCVSTFTQYQVDAIKENLELYDCMKGSQKQFIVEVKCKEFNKLV